MNITELVHQRLCQLDPRPASALEEVVVDLVAEASPLSPAVERTRIAAEVLARIDGLGPLHPLAIDPEVTEIMVNAGRDVWVERAGQLARVDMVVEPDEVWELARRLASRVGRQVDRTHPAIDVRLADGSRLHAIVPPLAIDGPSLTIRRFARRRPTLTELADPAAADVHRRAMHERATIVVAGPTASGKTSLLNALGVLVSGEERIVTIEEAAELHLPDRHVVRLETSTIGDADSVGVRELVRHALRMRPDRILCGEMRGAEALDLVQAMNTGHRGSLTTVHANSADDVLRRIETMMLTADAELPLAAVRAQLRSCIDLIVMMARGEGARRLVIEIARIIDTPAEWRTEAVWSR